MRYPAARVPVAPAPAIARARPVAGGGWQLQAAAVVMVAAAAARSLGSRATQRATMVRVLHVGHMEPCSRGAAGTLVQAALLHAALHASSAPVSPHLQNIIGSLDGVSL